jgi:hypothetical protein
VPLALLATVLLLRRGYRAARRIDAAHLLDLSRPLAPRHPVPDDAGRPA